MLKKIKQVKEMRLDELIRYVWDNNVKGELYFPINSGYRVRVDENGVIFFSPMVGYKEGGLYKVEIEEPITEDTAFDTLIEIFDEDVSVYRHNIRIKDIKGGATKKIYALIDGELQLIWERRGME